MPNPRRDPVFAASLALLALAGVLTTLPLPSGGIERATTAARVLAATAVLLAAAVRRPESDRTRGFWWLIAVSMAFLLAVQLWRLQAGMLFPEPASRPRNLLFLGRYLFIVMALELRPDWSSRGRSEEQLRLLDTAGAVLFLFALIAYALVSPALEQIRVSARPVPLRALYVVLDLFLVLRAVSLRVHSRSPHWRNVYAWLAGVLVLRTVNNFLGGYQEGSLAPIGSDPATGPLWLLMLAGIVVAARLEPDATAEAAVDDANAPAPARLAPLVGYAFALPVFHFLMEAMGVVGEDTAGSRETVVLAFLGSAALLLWIYQRVLIRDNRRLERERALMAEQRAQASRLEAIGRLAGGVAHDFNNLLTVIRGRTELVLVEHPDDEGLREDLNAIREATRRAEGVTRQLLAFGRRQMLRPEVLDLGAVVGEMAPLLRSAVSDEVRLSVAVRDPAPLIVADQGQVEMALLNLAVNAREAMPGGGRLALTVECVELDQSEAVAIPETRPGRYVLLTVMDTGRGMDETTLSRLFEPFFTTKPFGSGAGLGLPAVHGFVRQSGGAVQVESQPGRGATFRIYLPRVEAMAAEIAAVVEAEASIP